MTEDEHDKGDDSEEEAIRKQMEEEEEAEHAEELGAGDMGGSHIYNGRLPLMRSLIRR